MAAAWQTVAARSEGLGTDLVITKPTGTADGDLLVFVGVCGAGQTISKPDASWTTHANSLGGQAPLFYKIASSEPANYTFVVSGSVSSVGQIARISGNHASTPIDDARGAFATSGNLVPASVTSSGANRLLFGMACKLTVSATFTHPGTMTERYDTTVTTQNVSYEGADEIVGSGATGTRTWTPSAGTSPGVAYMMAVAPVPPEEGTFTGAYDFSGTFTGEAGPGEGTFTGDYDFSGTFTGEAPGVASGSFAGDWDFSGTFTGQAPPAPSGAGRWTPGGRDRFTARRTPKNRRRVR